jgi:hypothetical protein
MGEAKRKKNRPCICGSGLLAGTCCYGTGGWRKEAGDIRLDDTGFSGSHANCYLSSTNTCSTKISSEHVISGSVLNVLTEKSIEISGVPWLKPGEKKRIGIASLVANCLCTAHNSSLSALDTAAGKFFEAIQKCGTTETRPGLEFIVNGHDIERWFLKMLAGMSVSNYLGANGVPLTGFHSSIDIVGLLQDPRKWMPPLGLYFTQSLGHRFRREDSFALAPLSLDESGEIAGMLGDVQGLHIAVLAINRPIQGSSLERSSYRPGRINFIIGDARHTILLSWDDGFVHGEITLTWDK